ncbi:hypothetical protein J7430_06115, partial [Xanthomonas axonopodis pv. begoniae]|nr:hypothetical protein [Xanthomonas axonopodis pv. begoniae]
VRTNYLRTLSKNLGSGLSAVPVSFVFPCSEPPIIAGFFVSSTPCDVSDSPRSYCDASRSAAVLSEAAQFIETTQKCKHFLTLA